MEQSLGHVTVAKNLRFSLDRQRELDTTWLPVEFGVGGLGARLPLYRSNWSVRASARALRAVSGALARRPHDALLFHTQVTSLFSVPLMRRVPTVVSLDATPLNYDSVGPYYGHLAATGSVVDRLKKGLNRAAFRSARALVSWSEWAKDSLVRDYGVAAERVRVIPPGAAPAYFEVGRERLAQPPRADAGRVRLLFVGGDFARKGGPLLLEATRGALERQCELHVVTGSDVALPSGATHVHVHRGLTANSRELLALFRDADVFVLPSRADCLAVVLMEATAAALPVITTSVGALGEAVEDGESGLVVPAGDAAALRAAIEDLVGHPARRRRMARNAHELARRRFQAAENNRALVRLVAQVASAS
jgi:glycosyltransferase involved in cell wall biosynthesis